MQTFLPYPDFTASARCLDRLRLGKQRIEALQIYEIITGRRPGSRWRSHPAVRMWRGHDLALAYYVRAVIGEWTSRGYRNSMVVPAAADLLVCWPNWCPPWLGDPAFHAAHRSNLLRKDPVHYGRFGWTESPDLPYVWPVPWTVVPA
jgi:hypothetical protein